MCMPTLSVEEIKRALTEGDGTFVLSAPEQRLVMRSLAGVLLRRAVEPIVKSGERGAREVYAAFCNTTWVAEFDPNITIAFTWRGSGGFVDMIATGGESEFGYMNYYAEGNEGVVSKAVRSALKANGIVQKDEESES